MSCRVVCRRLVVSRVTPKTYRHLQLPPDLVAEGKQLPKLDQDLYVSNIYFVNECILLIWLNFFLRALPHANLEQHE